MVSYSTLSITQRKRCGCGRIFSPLICFIGVSPLASHYLGCSIWISPLVSHYLGCFIGVSPLASHYLECFIWVSPLASYYLGHFIGVSPLASHYLECFIRVSPLASHCNISLHRLCRNKVHIFCKKYMFLLGILNNRLVYFDKKFDVAYSSLFYPLACSF